MGKLVMKILAGLGTTVAIVFLILYTGGFFDTGKIEPGRVMAGGPPEPEPTRTVRATLETITEWFKAVGTVRPRTETNIEARINARVEQVSVTAGEEVHPGQRLITLDDREFQSRLEQAEQAVAAAQAEFDRAKSDYNRFQKLYQSRTVSTQELDKARAAFLGAQASVRQAEKQVEGARTALTYTSIMAVDKGQVVKRNIEPGDMAFPGKSLLVIQTSEALRLEALIREGLIDRVRPGTKLKVNIDSLNLTLEGEVEELEPSADPQTRTFLIKVAIPSSPDLFPGMFGRLLVPVDQKEVVTAPLESIRRVGQLEMVRVKTEAGWKNRFVRTGQLLDDRIEILSGLSGGETLAVTER